jgi:hypothetical protein
MPTSSTPTFTASLLLLLLLLLLALLLPPLATAGTSGCVGRAICRNRGATSVAATEPLACTSKHVSLRARLNAAI